MALFDHFSILELIATDRSVFDRIADALTTSTDPAHREVEREFMDAVDSTDEYRINKDIEDAFRRFTGRRTMFEAMSHFCRQFGIEDGLGTLPDAQAILFIDSHRDEILKKLQGVGQPNSRRR